MATVAIAKVFDAQVTASETDGTYVYLGTNKGDIIRFTIATEVVSTIASLGSKIKSMSIYSGVLYCGLANGSLATVTL
ncbi:MAG: hypothetical protein CVU62_13210 [Deltaproteobacteria bacterium HGW-Deltaproteobacteria-2]|jgi:hypothetical protein|nr:MAG: hypothetical protein CVU62_13210 [Deltaproteobacteria bacterium HGW-Deltaproteobacteria-2]